VQRMLRRPVQQATSTPGEPAPTASRLVRLDARRWLGAAGLASANWLTDCMVLAIACVSLGIAVPWAGLLFAYVVPGLVPAP